MDGSEYLVLVKCLTFNHEAFIQDTMDGFCTQQTTFPFVCIIIDDASTDGEPVVIQKYLEQKFDIEGDEFWREENDDCVRIFARNKDNRNCHFVVILLKYNHYSLRKPKLPYFKEWVETKYIALCEGDDYWTDPLKLQKQVDFMEAHDDFVFTAGYSKSYIQDSNTIQVLSYKPNCDFRSILLNGGIGVATCTVLYRRAASKGWGDFVKDLKLKMGDFPLFLYMAQKGFVNICPEYYAVYRRLPESASHSNNYDKSKEFAESVGAVQTFFASRYAPDLLPAIQNNMSIKLYHNALKHKKKEDVKLYFSGIKHPSIKDIIRYLLFIFKYRKA